MVEFNSELLPNIVQGRSRISRKKPQKKRRHRYNPLVLQKHEILGKLYFNVALRTKYNTLQNNISYFTNQFNFFLSAFNLFEFLRKERNFSFFSAVGLMGIQSLLVVFYNTINLHNAIRFKQM